ncbi:MAG: SusC/RagA family TonB-linked outer membrane protein, partial [Bacteroidales bacterium]|nr:SusC/RagA family TonB-linked outer membrane protein [Bacteroidales bacterium]
LTDMIDGLPTFYDAIMAWDFMASGVPASSNNYYSPDDKLLSFFGRVNYDFDRRYSIGATLRTDGSSKFARGHRWGFFPSAAASWTISNEPFMSEATNVDQLKLRYSFGTAGNNNIPSGQLLKQYASSTSSWLSMTNNIFTAGKIMNNPDLTWETTYTHNVGLDFSFWQSKLSGSVEVYQNDTKDLLINFPITGSGYDSQYQNVGSTRNRGVELTINAPIVSNKDFSLNFSGNIAYNVNRVTDLGGLESITAQSYWASTEIGDDYIVQVGQPLGNMYGYQSDGFYTTDDFDWDGTKWVLKEGVVNCSEVIGESYMRPGALKLKDQENVPIYDEDGNITGYTSDGKVTVADRTIIGNAAPDFTGGFSLSAFWKGFDLSANFNFMLGNQVYNANKIEFTSSRKFYNRNLVNMMDVDKRWTNVDWETGELINDPETLKALNAGKTMWNPAIGSAIFTDWAVEDASFLRLQTLTLGYTLPEKLTEKIHLRKARIYATGTNLLCLTKYSGFDPEVDTRRSTPLTPGVDYSAYPKSIGFVAGINLTF